MNARLWIITRNNGGFFFESHSVDFILNHTVHIENNKNYLFILGRLLTTFLLVFEAFGFFRLAVSSLLALGAEVSP